jgi:hypothetical protein
MKCQCCDRDFPDGLINEMAVGDASGLRYAWLCPPCALVMVNEAHGLPPGTPFRGPNAARLHAEALAHLKATGQG